ncbi:MAG: M1 family aminopeptidase [Rhodothalassiaceae bacterium]
MLRRLATIAGLFALLALTIWWVSLDARDQRVNAAAAGERPPMRLDMAGIIPQRYQLSLVLLPEVGDFTGTAEIELALQSPRNTLRLNGQDLQVDEVSAVTADGADISGRYQEEDSGLGFARLEFDEPLPAGSVIVTLSYRAAYAETPAALYRVEANGAPYLFSQLQPFDARRVFPGFDQPDIKIPYEIDIITHDGLTVVSNGPKAETVALGRGLVQHRFEPTPPLPSYLLAFAVGPLQRIDAQPVPPTAQRPRPLPVAAYAVAGRAEAMRDLLDSTRLILPWLESYVDAAFPFAKLDLVAVPEFVPTGMENAGAIFYDESLALMPVDADLSMRARAYRWHGHEIAHHWFGNYVTPRWWDDLWLNESFAVWMGYKVAERLLPDQARGGARQSLLSYAMETDSHVNARRLRGPVTSPTDALNAFDIITYEKGAGLLRMYERYLGEAQFRDGIRLYIDRFGGGLADTDDFLTVLNEASGRGDLAASLSTFLYQTGVPWVRANLTCPASERPEVRLTQQRFLPYGSDGDQAQTWVTPVCLRYGFSDGRTGRQCQMVETGQSRMSLTAQACPSWILPDAGAAGYYRWSLPESEWLALVARIDRLDDAELQSTVQNMVAAVEAGSLSLTTFLASVEFLAEAAPAPVLLDVMPFLKRLVSQLSDPQDRSGLQQFYRLVLTPRLTRLGLEERPEDSAADRALRGRLMMLLANWSDDELLRRHLAQRAVRVLEQPDRAPTMSLVHPLFAAGTLEYGPTFVKAALHYARQSASPGNRLTILASIGQAADPDSAAVVRGTLLTGDWPETAKGLLLHALMERPEMRQANWVWLEDNAGQLLPGLSEFGQQRIAEAAQLFCSEAERQRVASFFERRVALSERLGHVVPMTLERIALCTALKQKLQPAIRALGAEG